MIRPLPASEVYPFFVCDIENRSDGSVLWIDFCWRDDDNEFEHMGFPNWDDAWKWLFARAKDDKKFRTIFAHNGGGWDWLSLAYFLLHHKDKDRFRITANCSGSKMVTMSVIIDKKCTLHFCDSLQLLRSSLDKLATVFTGRGKLKTDGKLPEELWDTDRIKFFKYLYRDTESLLEVLENSLALIRSNIAEIPRYSHTVGGTAMSIFKTMMDDELVIPWDNELKDHLRNGYRGGRVELFRAGHYENVFVYDINSLYPSVMLDYEVPYTDRGFWTNKFHDDLCGCYEVNFCQKNRDIPAVMILGGEGAYEGNGTFFHPEIELLRELDPNATIDVVSGYVFQDSKKLFAGYVNKLYNLRISDPDGPLSLLCKYLLNSLYGKFGQKSERETVVSVSSFEELLDYINDDAEIRPISDDYGVYGVTTNVSCGHEHVGIAGTITSAARVRLYRGLLDAGSSLVYCDTDSVHTTAPFDASLVSPKIGLWKKEFQGEGIFVGKKLYALRDQTGEEKIRAKGVSVGGNNGFRLGFDDFHRLLQGEEIVCRFQQPSTPLEVFTGKQPCKFHERKRTIRMIQK